MRLWRKAGVMNDPSEPNPRETNQLRYLELTMGRANVYEIGNTFIAVDAAGNTSGFSIPLSVPRR
ncbi:MAG: hypothetical protein Q8P22_03170 [Chloroflexota bacterium]|nr:hypothetical protein [Chloroflexota bacterium]